MKLTDFMTNTDGILEIAGVKVSELVQDYGTPLYIYNEDLLYKTAKSFKENFHSHVFETKIIYASKACSFISLLKLYQNLGLSLDVVSEGELYTAVKAGFSPENIVFHGNNKLDRELKMAIDLSVGTIVIDNLDEAKRLSHIAEIQHKTVSVLLRANPCVEAHTHSFIKTASSDSKFGISIVGGAALHALEYISKLPYMQLNGIHSHIGSQIFSESAFIKAARVMLDFMSDCKAHGISLPILNLGGGFGVYYTEDDSPFNIPAFLRKLSRSLEDELAQRDLNIREIWLEPGRSLVNESGTTLYEVGDIKIIDNEAKYIFIDGGMGDNLRPSLYGAKYEAIIANRLNNTQTTLWNVAGKYCESGDILIKNSLLAEPQKHDILAVLRTGAYSFSMFTNYNRLRRPAVVFVSQGKARLVVRRESLEDIIALDIDA